MPPQVSRLTIALLTISYGVSIILRTKWRILNASRLKPAPGIQVGKFFTGGTVSERWGPAT